ncbi:unnamed protein product [Menidia menidia]|uniref:(Atlantic silverside) hypothetical protein n=1 Tax=Menidia menidia TaxID=238744 RepID=A0A8S4BYT6_9TELE|nr:unnamed protein product [Menidia menidia]
MCQVEEDYQQQLERAHVPSVSKKCVKCKEGRAAVVIRVGDAYCRNCFRDSFVHKFRAMLGKTRVIFPGEKVVVTQSTEGFVKPQEIKTLGVGDYFGERALISEDVRSANIICNENDTHCLVVDRDNFNQMVGTYEELQASLKEYVEELSRSDERRNFMSQSPPTESAEGLEMQSLRERIALLPAHQPFQELVVIATLGVGGFGRVELVSFRSTLIPIHHL